MAGCGDTLSLADLQTAKKHQLFEAEVITGKQGGVASGADIDEATNQVTGQTQKTLPAVLRDAGFQPAAFDFTTGGTLGVNDRNKVVYDPVSKTWYSWAGLLPHVIAAGTNPVGVADWKPQTDPDIRTYVDAQFSQLRDELDGSVPLKYAASSRSGTAAIRARVNTRYRIGTFNTYVGYWRNFSTNWENGYGVNIKYIQEMILRYQLDFCGFQEFQSGQVYPVSCLKIPPYTGSYFGKVTPLSDHNGSSQYDYGNAIVYNGSAASTTSAVYTAGTSVDKRGYTRTVHTVRGITVAIYCTHLAATDAPTRLAQMNELAAVVNADVTPRKLVIGDFNTDVASDFNAFTSAGFIRANNNDVNTATSGTWYFDNILYKGFTSLVLKGAGDPFTFISDHKMFYAEFEV